MFRKIASLIIILAITATMGLSAFAGGEGSLPGEVEAFTTAASNNETDQFLVTITKPDASTDSTYRSSYVISGYTESKDVRVALAIYDEDLNSYTPYYNTDGEYWWDIGSYGVFSKEIALSKGTNKISVMAYRTSAEDLSAEDIQVCNFTITLLDKNILQKIMNSAIDLASGLFSPLKK